MHRPFAFPPLRREPVLHHPLVGDLVDDDIPLGWECACPQLQIERWEPLDAAGRGELRIDPVLSSKS